jgi:CofD-related protein of GAK system
MKAVVDRLVDIPDEVRVARCRRLPEYGPRVLFFSGGTACRELSSCLKFATHNSIHLMTPFDSGGSSAILRDAFDMLAVGDLRNRLMALADETELGTPAIARLFSHRLHAADFKVAQAEFASLISGASSLLLAIDMPMRSIVTSQLRWVAERMPADFELRGASVGNLVIVGVYLQNERDISTALYLISKLVIVRGLVRPTTTANLHLRATLSDGQVVVGQHNLGKAGAQGHRITRLELVPTLVSVTTANAVIDPAAAQLVATADVIVYPMGSFFGSVMANLLPRGVGAAIVHRRCPKVYIPNTGEDPEMAGYTLAECVQIIIDHVRRDAGEVAPVSDIVQYVLVDTARCSYCVPVDAHAIAQLGVRVLDMNLASSTAGHALARSLSPERLVDVLISLGS